MNTLIANPIIFPKLAKAIIPNTTAIPNIKNFFIFISPFDTLMIKKSIKTINNLKLYFFIGLEAYLFLYRLISK